MRSLKPQNNPERENYSHNLNLYVPSAGRLTPSLDLTNIIACNLQSRSTVWQFTLYAPQFRDSAKKDHQKKRDHKTNFPSQRLLSHYVFSSVTLNEPKKMTEHMHENTDICPLRIAE